MRDLGVGLVYWAALDPLMRSASSSISVVELEPQTLWEKISDAAGWHYRVNEALLERVVSLPQAKLMHGVGHPVGGTVRDPVEYLPLLRDAADRLDPAWISEHLSFNRLQPAGEHAGFLLPPPQSAAAVRVAAQNISELRRALGRPVAFETGVNYLCPRKGELDDGDFFAAVAHTSRCGILLDLHNLWCNERNGRQSVAEAIARIPLERVWEIHLAGGMEMSGYWLDAHSGAVPPEVMEIAARLIPSLPNLGALIFEVLPEHLPRIGLDGVQRQVEEMQQLWRMRAPRRIQADPISPFPRCNAKATRADFAAVARWTQLAGALRAKATSPAASSGLLADPGCILLRGLVGDFRRANLAQALHYTITALLAGLGPQRTHLLFDAYFAVHAPEPFAAIEADRFADFLRARLPLRPRIAYFEEVLAFEHALVRATIHGASSEITWSADPTLLFDALEAGKLPSELPAVHSVMHICAS